MEKIRRYPLSLNTDSPVYGLGLLTDEPGYRLCWLINHTFSWNLAKTSDLIVPDKGSPVPQLYARFESGGDQLPAIKLISNRSQEGIWLTVFQQLDFILVISGPDNGEQFLEELKSSLTTKIPQIRGLFKVPLPSFCYL